MKWATHAMCGICWDRRYPDREAVRLRDLYRDEETCCFCGKTTKAGIYVRANDEETICGVTHD